MSFHINNNNFDEALAKGWFAKATDIRLYNLSLVEVPPMPEATFVHLDGLPLIEVVPAMPKATHVYLHTLPRVKVVPEMPKAIYVGLFNLPFTTGFVKQDIDLSWITLNDYKIQELKKSKTYNIKMREICPDYKEYTVCFTDEADEAEFIMRQS